jgi:hypothetical protein
MYACGAVPFFTASLKSGSSWSAACARPQLAVPGHPLFDRVAARLREPTLTGTPVDGTGSETSKAIADGAFAQVQLARDGAMGLPAS